MKTLINIKVEPQVKTKVQQIARDLGFSMSALVNAFFKELISSKTVIFTTTSKMSPTLERTLSSIEQDIALNRNLSPKFSTAKKAIKYLDSK